MTKSTPLLVELLAIAQAELERLVRTGQGGAAERVFQQFPELAGSNDDALELVLAEFVQCHQLGRKPDPADWYRRFPHWQDRLERLFGFHDLLTERETWSRSATATLAEQISQPTGVATTDHPPGFTILDEIGRGGMAVVYRARQTALNRVVAIKVLRHLSQFDDSADAHLRREAELAARLQHPNIVQVFAVGDWAGAPYLAMEYVAGGTLENAIGQANEAGGIAPHAAAQLVETLARAVAYAHGHGIVHRDLKPANVLLQVESSTHASPKQRNGPDATFPKIADFGLAIPQDPAESLRHSTSITGTPCYMAPEQAEGRSSEVGPLADVYGLGGILYELLVGQPAFRGDTVAATLDQVRHREPIQPRQIRGLVPIDLETICLKCLEKEPGRRYSSAAELADDLHRFHNGEPIRARPISTIGRVQKWVRRRPAIASLCAAVVLMIGIAGAALLSHHQQRQSSAINVQRMANDLELASAAQTVAKARSQWQANQIADAQTTLQQCPAYLRDTEWKSLDNLCRAEVQCWTGPNFCINKLTVSSDGTRLAARQRQTPQVLAVIDTGSGEHLSAVPTGNYPNLWEFGGDNQSLVVIRQINASANKAKPVAAVTPEQTYEVAVWNLGNNSIMRRWPIPENAMAISRSGQRVTAADSQHIRIWDVANGQVIAEIEASLQKQWRLPIAFDARDQRVAMHLPKEIRVWDIASGQRLNLIPTSPGTLGSLAFRGLDDCLFGMSDRAVITSEDKAHRRAIVGWNLQNNQRELELPTHISPIFTASPDGRFIAYLKHNTIELFSARNGISLATLRGHVNVVFCLAFSPDSRRLYSSGLDNTLRTWNLDPWRE